MSAIYERELDSQLNGLTGYIYGALMLLFGGIYVMAYNLSGYTQFSYVLYSMEFVMLIAVPLLTMRSIAEERHQRTDQLLYSLPMSMTKIVLGKYFALVTVMALPMIVMALYPVVINAMTLSGSIPLKSAYGALVGFFFLGLALVAIGLFISSLVENGGVAAGCCFIVLLLLYFLSALTDYMSSASWVSFLIFTALVVLLGVLLWRLTKNGNFALIFSIALEAVLLICFLVWQDAFSGLIVTILEQLAVFDRFDNFTYDIFDITSIVYYVSVAAEFLFLTGQSMER
ncbi:MAG: ABC transporter permease, partial [Oscillospiraceae bacterium]|nr:ABC transporter permease [Oscillospiraceae bacterium]